MPHWHSPPPSGLARLLLRTWRRGRADDISYTYLGVFAAGVLGWLAYGLVAEQPAVFAANVVTFTLIAALTLLKTHPRRPPDGSRR